MPGASKYKILRSTLMEARQKRHLTQSGIAELLGKPQSFVSKYESGERRLDVIEFIEVCEALSTDPNSVLKIVRAQHG